MSTATNILWKTLGESTLDLASEYHVWHSFADNISQPVSLLLMNFYGDYKGSAIWIRRTWQINGLFVPERSEIVYPKPSVLLPLFPIPVEPLASAAPRIDFFPTVRGGSVGIWSFRVSYV